VTDLAVIVPSRGRPDAAVQLAAAFTATGATARLVFAVDEDDPTRFEYTKALEHYGAATVHYVGAPSNMVRTLNAVAGLFANQAFALGFMGDGHMAPATLTHLYVDNYWRDLGQGAGCLRYLPDVIVEHMHPIAGKAEWDDGHVRVNALAMYQRDSDAYADYAGSHLLSDVEKVRALRGAA
jgi:hypothetical protein